MAELDESIKIQLGGFKKAAPKKKPETKQPFAPPA